jgi:protocatechuate 3,4-dioxygenase beta subunit
MNGSRALALAVVLALAAGTAAVLFPWGGGPRGEGGDAAGDADATAPGPALGPAAGGPGPPPYAAPGDGAGLAPAAPVGTGAVRVRVLDGTARVAVEDVSVALAGRSADGRRVSVSARTGEAGDATLEGVPAGDAYVLRVSPRRGRSVELHDVAVAEGETTDLGVLFTGAVGVVTGLVVDDDGAPVDRADVSASVEPDRLAAERDPFPRAEPFGRPVATATTGPDGAFRLEEIPAGLVALRAHAEGRRTALDRVLVDQRPEPVERRLVLTRGVVLRGEVVDGSGTGMSDVDVAVIARRGVEPRARLRTDARGRFELAGFGAERVALDVVTTPPGGWPVAHAVDRVDEPLRLVLASGATLEVVAIDVHTAQPVREAEVRHTRAPGPGTARADPASEVLARTDARGVAALDLRPGTVPAPRVTAEGYRATEKFEGDRTRPLAAGETRTVRVFLRRPTLLFGRVTWADGSGARALRVLLAGAKGPIRHAGTDAAGDYRLRDVPPLRDGSLSVAYPDERASHVVPVPPITGEEAGVRVDVSLPDDPPRDEAGRPAPGPRASVRGRVVDAAGDAVAGARVEGGTRPVFTDATGAYHVPDGTVVGGVRPVDPSVVAVAVSADGFAGRVVSKVPANAGDEVRAADVVLDRGMTLRGFVVGPGGRPVPFARVWLDDRRDGEPDAVTADAGGAFALHGLARRDFTAVASAPFLLGKARVRAERGASENVVTLRAVADVRGRVTDDRGAPVEGARVEVVFDAAPRDVVVPAKERTGARTGPDGEFRLFTSASNASRLRVWARGWTPMAHPLPRTPEPVEVRLGR